MSDAICPKAVLFSDPERAAEYAQLEADYAELERRGPKLDTARMHQLHGYELGDNQKARDELIDIERRLLALRSGGNAMPSGVPVVRMTDEEEVRSMPPAVAAGYVELQQTHAALERLNEEELTDRERELRFARLQAISRQTKSMIESNLRRRFRDEGESPQEAPAAPVVPFSSSWRTADVIALARQMHDSWDYSAMPILADALQDAGCDSAEVLNHCRDGLPHARGCWVIALILG